MGLRVLGPLEVDGLSGRITPRDRIVLEVLVVLAGEPVTKEVLAEALWGDALPASWQKIVHGCISRLRGQLPAGLITTSEYGYRLDLHEDELDARAFERHLQRGREQLADGDPERALFVLGEALGLWRGRALPDLDEWAPGRTEATRLDGLRSAAQELRVEAQIRAGKAESVLEDARALVADAPTREHRWALLAEALYQSGRQSDALEVLRGARRMLLEELGLDPGPDLVELEQAILRQDLPLAQRTAEALRACPYRGLLPYEVADADGFFGRGTEVAECLQRLRERGVVAIVGPSGSGKSSLVRAGLVAAIQRDGERTVLTTPGIHPLDSLAGLDRKRHRPVLVVDQAEEAMTLCADSAERSAYIEEIVAYDGPRVIALRADRIGDLSAYPAFGKLIESGLYLLAGMSPGQLEDAITGPARQAGLRLEAGLTDLLVREVADEPGALPLLSHVLRRTWDHREGNTLTVAGYRATGGVRDAVNQSAEQVYAGLDDRQREQLHSMFLRLVSPSEDGEPVRARVARRKLAIDPSYDDLIETLVSARLVSSDDGEVQIAHEALAREWPRLREWLHQDVEGQRILRHLSTAAEAWEALSRPESELYRGVRLANAREWATRTSPDLTDVEQAFLEASQRVADLERVADRERLRTQTRINRRLRAALGGIAALLVMALLAGLFAVRSADRADQEAARAASQAAVAQARRLAALAQTTTEPDVSVLLAAEAVRLHESGETRSNLNEVLGKFQGLSRVTGADTGLLAVAVSSDGGHVATASTEGVTLYSPGNATPAVRADVGPMAAVVFSPDGRYLAALPPRDSAEPPEAPLTLLDATTLRPVVTMSGFPPGISRVVSVAFSADGRRVAAYAMTKSSDLDKGFGILTWDLARPTRPISVIRAFSPFWAEVLLSPDASRAYLVRGDPNQVSVHDVVTGKLLMHRSFTSDLVESTSDFALSPDGKLLALSVLNGTQLYSVPGLRPVTVLPSPAEDVSALAFSRESRTLATGSESGTTSLWDLRSATISQVLKGHSGRVTGLAFSPDDRSLYSTSDDAHLLTWSLDGSHTIVPHRQFVAPADAISPWLSADGRYVQYLRRGQPHHIWFLDAKTGRLSRPRPLLTSSPASVWLGFSPDSRHFVNTGGEHRILEVWDPAEASMIAKRTDADAMQVTFPDTTSIAVSGGRGQLRWLDLDTLVDKIPPIDLGIGPDPNLYADPLRHRVIAVRQEQNDTGPDYVVADLRTGKVTEHRSLGFDPIPWFSPDGRRVIVGGADGHWGLMRSAELYASSPRWLVSPTGHDSPGWAQLVTWNEDQSLVAVSEFGDVTMWDARSLERLGAVPSVDGENLLAPSMPDGHTLLMPTPSGSMLEWDTRPTHPLDTACAIAGHNLSRDFWREVIGDLQYHPTCTTKQLAATL